MNKHFILSITFLLLFLSLYGCSNKQKEVIETVSTNQASNDNEVSLDTIFDDEANSFADADEPNDFCEVLDGIKNTHPGTAGCSLQSLYNARNLLNACKSKLPLSIIAQAWLNQYSSVDYADIHESFVFLQDTLKNLRENDDKTIFYENEISSMAPYDKILYDLADETINIILEKTK